MRMNDFEICIETLQSHLRSIDASYRNPLETKKNHNGYLSRRHPHSVRSRFSHPGPITTLLLKINYSELYKTTVSHLIQREENWNTFIGHVQRSGPPRAICRLEAFWITVCHYCKELLALWLLVRQGSITISNVPISRVKMVVQGDRVLS